MEVLDVEIVAELDHRVLMQLEDLQHSGFVGGENADVAEVEVDLPGGQPRGGTNRVNVVVNSLLTAPPVVMETGVDDQTCSAQELPLQTSQLAVDVVVVPAHFFRQVLGIKGPTLDKGGVKPAALGEQMHILLGADGNLEVMAGDRFVVRDGPHPISVVVGLVAEVIGPGPRTVERSVDVEPTTRSPDHDDLGLRFDIEDLLDVLVGLSDKPFVERHDICGADDPRVHRDPVVELLEGFVGRVTQCDEMLPDLAADPLGLGQTLLVDLGWSQVGGCVMPDPGIVKGSTIHREREELVNRVIRLHLSETLDQITAIDVLDQDHPLYSNPTTGAIAGDWFYYIATAQFERFDEDGNLAPWDELSDTYVLKLRLE